jgi:DNA-binding NtrC family response regulator
MRRESAILHRAACRSELARQEFSFICVPIIYFLEKFAREHGRPIKRNSTPAIDMLASYLWPGDVRELENTIERAVLICDGEVIHGHHLPPSLQTAEASGTVTRVSLKNAVVAYEKDLIQDELKTTRGNRAKAARYSTRPNGSSTTRYTPTRSTRNGSEPSAIL